MKNLKDKFKISLISTFALAFTFFMFGTAELYITNREEFWFTYGDMFPIIIILSILVVGILTVSLMLLPTKIFKYGVALILGFTLSLYIQGNFLPNDYGSLDGTSIDWSNYQGRLVYNSIIWCILIGSSIFLAYKKEKLLFSISQILSGILLATQIVTLITICLTFPKVQTENEAILSIDGQFEISKNNNTFVFILDCFDSELFCELLQQYPSEIEENLEDFTFYHNTLGGATRTKYAIPYILTGQTNTGSKTYWEYLNKSFSSSPLFEELRTEHYDARLYTSNGYIDLNQTKAIENIVNGTVHSVSAWGLTKDFLQLTAFRYMPHALKHYFWMYSEDFEKWKDNTGEYIPYTFNDSAFYNKILTENIHSSIEKDVFRFYHLDGAHPPYIMDENCERISGEQVTEQQQAMGALKIIYEFIHQLKEINAYENSTIFIMSDHGSRDYEQNPLFLVKLRGVQQKFQQSEIPLSYKDIPNMFTDSLTGTDLDIEEDYVCQGERYFYIASEDNNQVNISEYVTQGDAYNAANLQLSGDIFSNEQLISYKYKVGTKLSFARDATANAYCISGLYANEVTHTWAGNSAEMYFELDGEYDDLTLILEYGSCIQEQKVKIYANENVIADFIASEPLEKRIPIPGKYIVDGTLKLNFEFPDAVSPESLGIAADSRDLSLCLHSICIAANSPY